ncbi:DinB family protein [Actinomadura kijaniata]|uniref:DinB-like domain-containing protein n=1 Tax=Actinomadura namibiensis TaxID=182080 RepID=A0A7W3QSC5_ACTNM|nr:DinB family protein [Actinomadura namibiensis]MBA8957581.1 hypothetical protein [Actinomadura namibiensis]
MNRTADALLKAHDLVHARLLARLEGMTDAEYLWEPAPIIWTLRHDGTTGRWLIDGEGGGGPAPDPVPIPTIAWRIGHIGLTFLDFGNRLLADHLITLDDATFAGTATEAVDFLTTHYRYWREGLATLDDSRWWKPIGPKFNAFAEDTTTDLVLHVLDEFTHHGAEIGVLRDLYPHWGNPR